MPHENTILATWEISEYEERVRSNDWYWIVGFVALACIIIAILWHNYLFAGIILISTTLIVVYSIRRPRMIEIQISTEGIKIAHNYYPFQEIQAFWIVEQTVAPTIAPEATTQAVSEGLEVKYHLLLATKSMYHPFVKVSLPTEMNPFELREFLLQFIEEREITEPLGYKISERLGF